MQKTEQSSENYTGFILAEKLKMWMVFDSGSQLLPSGNVPFFNHEFHKTLEHILNTFPLKFHHYFFPLWFHFKGNESEAHEKELFFLKNPFCLLNSLGRRTSVKMR